MNEVDLAVRDAVRRMRIPDHQPDFWDQLAGQIDRIEGNRVRRQAASHRDVSAAIPRPIAAVPPVDAAQPRQAQPRQPQQPARPLSVDPRRVVIGPDGQIEPQPQAPAAAAAPPAARRFPQPQQPAEPQQQQNAQPQDEVLAPVVQGRFGARPEDRGAAGGRQAPAARRHQPTGQSSHAGRHGARRTRVERDLAVVPVAMRQQRSNIAFAALAAAAIAVVVFAGTTLVKQRTEVTNEAEALKAENTAFSTEALAASGNDPAARAVLAWVSQLGGGDADAAWDAMGPDSQASFGDKSGFTSQLEALAAGYGAWATTSADVVLVTPLTASDEGTVSVVTLIGTVEGDPRADAFPVRIVDGIAEIEAFSDAGKIGLETPDASSGSEVDVADELSVLVPAGVSPVIRLDQGPTQRCGEADGTTLEATANGTQRCSYVPATGMEAGGRVLTVAFTSPDGSEISARSVRFKAA